jgi:chemotaxis regulatin CheY-phosphate phosphatase CheZ
MKMVEDVPGPTVSAPSWEDGAEVGPSSGGDPAELQELLGRSYGVILKLVENLRRGRSLIQQSAVGKLHATDEKLTEISSTTESAAAEMLDGLDRALALVDRLEAEELDGRSTGLGMELREEIFGVMGHLQFQDITTQQLAYASSILREMETNLEDFASLLESPTADEQRGAPSPGASLCGRAFDPAATVADAADRQALVDELLKASAG